MGSTCRHIWTKSLFLMPKKANNYGFMRNFAARKKKLKVILRKKGIFSKK
jgi:hypothetical protein